MNRSWVDVRVSLLAFLHAVGTRSLRVVSAVAVVLGVVLSTLFLGATSSQADVSDGLPLYDDPFIQVSAGAYTYPYQLPTDAKKVRPITITSSSGAVWYSGSMQIYCRASGLTTTEKADIADDGTAVISGATTVSLGGTMHAVTSWTDPGTATCTAPAQAIAARYRFQLDSITRTMWFEVAAEPDAGTAECGTGVLSDVHVWENAEGVGYAFGWTGSTDWSKWYIHKTGSQYTTYGSLSGYVAAGAAPGYWRSDNDPVNTAIFAPGDSVKLRRYVGGNPTACWVEVTVASSPYDWRTAGESSADGPTDYGDATDPDTDTECSAFDIVCRIRSALVWAFVPSDAALEEMQSPADMLAEQWPFGLVADLYVVSQNWTVSDTCKGTPTVPSCWPDWEFAGVELVPYSHPMSVWIRDNRTLFASAIYGTLALGLALRVFWSVVPVVGGGGKGGD